jgi:hypothetical protein
MQDNIAQIVDRAFEIAAEPTALYVAVAVRRWHRQRKDLVFFAGDRELLARDLEKVLKHRRTIIGFLIIEPDGASFETLGNTTKRQARATIKDYQWSGLTLSDLRALVQP